MRNVRHRPRDLSRYMLHSELRSDIHSFLGYNIQT